MIGIDILEIDRVKTFAQNIEHAKKIFTKNEIEYYSKYQDPCERIAGMFCAKEAVLKALSCPNNISLLDIEILHKDNGEPYINLNKLKNKKIKIKKIEISISHTKTIATAICLIK